MVVATVASSTSVCGTLESGSTLSWTIGCPPTKENLSSSTPPMPTSSGAHSWRRHTQSKSHPHPHTITHTLLPHSHILTLYPHTITSYTSTLILTLSLHILCTLTPSHSHPYPHTLTLTLASSHSVYVGKCGWYRYTATQLNLSLSSLRLYGGYESLKGGKTSEAMVDFTGGVVESYELKDADDNLFKKILRNSKRSSLMSCSIK